MEDHASHTQLIVRSYLRNRKAIGVLGGSLPVLLVVGMYLMRWSQLSESTDPLPGSISAFYYTEVGNLFVGVLCAVGVFLVGYFGERYEARFWENDRTWSTIAGWGAVLTGLFPTPPDGDVSAADTVIGYVHVGAAAVFLGSLGYISLYMFTTEPRYGMTRPGKTSRNRIYRFMGWTIWGSLAMMALFLVDAHWGLLGGAADRLLCAVLFGRPIFVLESVAVVAFGASWLIKGDAMEILHDFATRFSRRK